VINRKEAARLKASFINLVSAHARDFVVFAQGEGSNLYEAKVVMASALREIAATLDAEAEAEVSR
jgi:hypothetical protein